METILLRCFLLGILVAIINCDQPLLTIAIENQNQIVCQASCQNQCVPKLRIVAQNQYIGNSYGSGITVHRPGKIMVICYLESINVTYTWIRKSFEAIRSPGLNLFEIGNRKTHSLRFLNPNMYFSKIGVFNTTAYVSCRINYPSREMQELSLYRVSADGIKSEVSMSAMNLSAYFNYDGSMVTVYYRHYFTYTEDYQNNTFECRAKDVFSGKFRVRSSEAYETGVKCTGRLKIDEKAFYFLSNGTTLNNQNYVRELECSCPNAKPEPNLHWTTPSGHRVYSKKISIRPTDMIGRYCCHVAQYLASSEIIRNEGCLMVGAKTGCDSGSTETTIRPPTRFSNMSARLEENGLLLVSLDGRDYGTVCRNYFGTNDAKVVCRILNLPSENPKVLYNIQGDFGRKKVLFDLHCGGYENNLNQCAYNLLGSLEGHCSSSVGVICRPVVNITARLEPNGLLLVSLDGGAYGTVCSHYFSANDARVGCRMLNLPSENPYVLYVQEDFGRQKVLFDLHCGGYENNLTYCSYNLWGSWMGQCSSSVGLICRGPVTNVTARLEPNGLLLLSPNGGAFGTVCQYDFDINDARVVCRMLNLNTTYPRLIRNVAGGNGSVIYPVQLNCTGSETSLARCSQRGWSSNGYCSHSHDIGVVCGNAPPHFTARLEPNGLLLVSRDGGVFGTVCDDAFDIRDARVVCRMLNLNTNNPRLILNPGGGYGKQILMDDLRCTGTETSLADCPYSGWGHHNCHHSEDIGVSCEEGYGSPRPSTYWY